jgi:hypothetical protein
MFTKAKIALSVAVVFGFALMSLPTSAFAGNVYDSPDWAPPLCWWDFNRHLTVCDFASAHGSSLAARGELNTTRRLKETRKSH